MRKLHPIGGYMAMDDGRGGGFEKLPVRPGHDEGRFDTLPARPGHDEGRFDTLPMRPGRDEGRFDTLPRHPGRGGGHPGRGHHPGPDFPGDTLEERIEDAGLAELLELAGRMVHRRPGGEAGRGQALVLAILAGREPLSQRALQQLLGIRPGSMSELVGKLERKGLLTREPGEDRRGNLLRLTEAGRAAVPEEPEDPDGELFDALTPEQRATLEDLLRALLRDWSSRVPPMRRERRDRPEEGPRPLPGPRTERV